MRFISDEVIRFVKFVISGNFGHTVRVTASRDEVLYNYRSAHRLHGRSIPSEYNILYYVRDTGRFYHIITIS